MSLFEFVQQYKNLLEGVTVIGGSIILFWKSIKKNIQRVFSLCDNIDLLNTQMAKVVHEVSPNGNSSIKDAVGRIEGTQQILQDSIIRMEALQLAGLHLTGKAYWLSEPDGRCKFASPKLSSLMGATPEQIEGFGWVSFVQEKYRDSVKLQWDKAVADRREFHQVYAFVHSDGIVVDVSCHAIPIVHAQTKEPLGMIGWAEAI